MAPLSGACAFLALCSFSALAGDDGVKEVFLEDRPTESSTGRGFCCMAAPDSRDFCGTCWAGAREGTETWCGQSQKNCEGCGNTWCERERSHRRELLKPVTAEEIRSIVEDAPRLERSSSSSRSSSTSRLSSSSSVPSTTIAWTRSNSRASDMSSHRNGCGSCSPAERVAPDVVIPFYERDLCKVGYTVKSIATHDPHHNLGNVILMWVSSQPSSMYKREIKEMTEDLARTRDVKVIDFSSQVNSGGTGGWFAQQVFKLKIASIVSSDYYLVLDAKNALIKDIEEDIFFTSCHKGKIFGEYHFDDIPQPHSSWYQMSAGALRVPPPTSGYWPSSITPMIMHRRTVLDMLVSIGENPSTTGLCVGPLCDMFGAHSPSGQGATEFTMYVLFAHSRHNFHCIHEVYRPSSKSLTARWAVSLWRGTAQAQADQMRVNLRTLRKITSGKEVPLMFGAQDGSLDPMPDKRRVQAVQAVLKIFARVHNVSFKRDGPEEVAEFLKCIIGGTANFALPPPATHHKDASEDEQPKQHTSTSNASEGDFCCTAAADTSDFCGTCWLGAHAKTDSFCGQSRQNCEQCGATWCSAELPAALDDGSDLELPEVLHDDGEDFTRGEVMRSPSEKNHHSKKNHSSLAMQEPTRLSSDGNTYTKEEFIQHYGGTAEWDAAYEDSCKSYGCVEYNPAHSCQCNSACIDHANCCSDYVTRCNKLAVIVMKKNLDQGPVLQAQKPLVAGFTFPFIIGFPVCLFTLMAFFAFRLRARRQVAERPTTPICRSISREMSGIRMVSSFYEQLPVRQLLTPAEVNAATEEDCDGGDV